MTERITEYGAPVEAGWGKRVSWPAVFGGTLVALAAELLFIAFGLFIGFQYSKPGGITTWAKIWYFVTAFCALFFGGWVTARLSTNTSAGGRIHAAVTWGLTTMATFSFALWILWGLLGTSIAAVHTVSAATNNAATTPAAPVAQNEATNLQRQAANTMSMVNQQGPELAAIIAGEASSIFLILFGGVLCGLVGCLVGGSVGRFGQTTPTDTSTGTPTTVRETNVSSRAASA